MTCKSVGNDDIRIWYYGGAPPQGDDEEGLGEGGERCCPPDAWWAEPRLPPLEPDRHTRTDVEPLLEAQLS